MVDIQCLKREQSSDCSQKGESLPIALKGTKFSGRKDVINKGVLRLMRNFYLGLLKNKFPLLDLKNSKKIYP